MTVITTIKSVALKAAQRTLQVLGFGKLPYFVQEYMPFGDDGCPVPGARALYQETANKNIQAISGYANTNQKSTPGEKGIYSTDANGLEKVRIQLRIDGTMEIGGNANHLTQYEALNTALQNEVTALNAELTKIQASISSLGGTYAKVNVNVDISNSKLTNIKTQ